MWFSSVPDRLQRGCACIQAAGSRQSLFLFCCFFRDGIAAGAIGGRSTVCQQNIRRAGATMSASRVSPHVMLPDVSGRGLGEVVWQLIDKPSSLVLAGEIRRPIASQQHSNFIHLPSPLFVASIYTLLCCISLLKALWPRQAV